MSIRQPSALRLNISKLIIGVGVGVIAVPFYLRSKMVVFFCGFSCDTSLSVVSVFFI